MNKLQSKNIKTFIILYIIVSTLVYTVQSIYALKKYNLDSNNNVYIEESLENNTQENNLDYCVNELVAIKNIITPDVIFKSMEKEVDSIIKAQPDTAKNDNNNIMHEVVPMDSYISVNTDENIIYNNEVSKQNKEFVISDQIYGNTYYIVKYINESGETKQFICENDNNKTVVYPREKFINTAKIEYSKYKADSTLSEYEYMDKIKTAVIKLLDNTDTENNVDIELDLGVEDIFSDDSLNELVQYIKEQVKNEGITHKGIGLFMFGKSKLEMSYIDRVYMQIEIVNNDNRLYTDILMKLDENSKIIDIDIL